MKRLFSFLIVLCLLGPATADDQGTVSVPLAKFLEMMKGKTVSHEPAVSGALTQGDYHLEMDQNWVKVTAALTVETFQQGWTELQLLPAEIVVASASVNGRPLALYEKDGHHTLMLKDRGRRAVRLVYHLPVSDDGPARKFTLQTPPTAASSYVAVLSHGSVQLTTTPRVPMRTTQEKNRTIFRGVLPAAQQVNFSWTPLGNPTGPGLHGKPDQGKPRLYARLYNLTHVAEKAVRCQLRIDYSILHNEIDRWVLKLDDGVEVLDLACPNLMSWSLKDGRLEVLLSEPVTGQQTLNLTLERPLENINGTWKIPTVELPNLERIKGSVGIATGGGIEVSAGEAKGMRAIDVTQLPAQVTQMSGSPLFMAYEYHQQPAELSLTTTKNDEIAVLNATIDKAEAMTLVTEEGRMATSYSFFVRNNRKQSMLLELPEGQTIWNAFVNERPVKPVTETDGRVRLPLVLSQEVFPVRITVVHQSVRLLPVHHQVVRLARVDIPISELVWEVMLPEERSVYSQNGTVEPAPQASREDFPPDLPVGFLVPRVGVSHCFTGLMVTDEMPTLSLVHGTDLLPTALGWMIFAAVVWLGSGRMQERRGWRYLAAGGVLSLVIPWTSLRAALLLLGALWMIKHREWLRALRPKRRSVEEPEEPEE